MHLCASVLLEEEVLNAHCPNERTNDRPPEDSGTGGVPRLGLLLRSRPNCERTESSKFFFFFLTLVCVFIFVELSYKHKYEHKKDGIKKDTKSFLF